MKPGRWAQSHYLQFLAGRLGRVLDSSWRSWCPSTPSPRGPADVSRPRIGAVQFRLDPVESADAWQCRLAAIFQRAVEAHLDILVFPEDMPMPLLGVVRRWLPPSRIPPHPAQVKAFLTVLSPIAYRHWRTVMQSLAGHFGILTVAGSGMTAQGGILYNQAVVISAGGEIIAEQPKMHVFAFERDWGVEPGPLTRQDAGSWPLYAVVCNDATYYETFRMVRHLGADLVAVPIADPEAQYSENKARRGTWARVQETPVCGIVGAGTGLLFGFPLSGKAGIYLPAELTGDGSGVLAESLDPYGEGLVTATVDLEALHDFQGNRLHLPPGPWHNLYQSAP